jgi:putative ABC transport system permease protein
MKYLPLILKNLLRSKRRTILTILSIAVSLFLFSALISLPVVARQLLADTASSVRMICINKAGLSYPLPEAYKPKIAAIPHVQAVVAQTWFGGIYHDVTDAFPNLSADPDQADVMWPDWNVSRQSFQDFKKIRTAALVGSGTMKRFHFHVGQQIMLRGTAFPFNVTLKLVGLTGGKAPPNFLMFRRDYLEELLGRPGVVSEFVVRADSSQAVPGVIAAIDRQFANSSAETQTESDSAFMNDLFETYRAIFRFAELLGILVVLTIALVAANTASMSIRERRAEIAVMLAMGFSSRVVLGLLVTEAVVIGLTGAIMGCGAAFLMFKLFSLNANAVGLVEAVPMPVAVFFETLALGALIGLLSAYIPARSAARRNIVEALRMVA